MQPDILRRGVWRRQARAAAPVSRCVAGIRAILDAMYPSTDYHGATVEARSVEGIVLVETRHAAGGVVARHAHDAPTLCVPVSGGFEEVAGRARIAVAAPAVIARGAGEP